MGFGDVKRRYKSHHIVACRNRQKVQLTQFGNNITVVWHRFHAQKKAPAAHFVDKARMLARNRIKPVTDQAAHLKHMVQETGFQNFIKHRIGRRRCQLIAAKGRPMHARRKGRCGLFIGQKGADREPAAKTLGRRHNIGLHVRPFIAKQLAGPANAGLNFVKHHKQAKLVGRLAHPFKVAIRRLADPAFALNGLKQNTAGVFGNAIAQFIEIAKGHPVKAIRHRAKALTVFLAIARGQRAQGPAMKRIGRDQYTVLLRMARHMLIPAQHLDARLVGLRTRITEEHRIGKTMGNQTFGQFLLTGHLIQVRCMPKFANLFGQFFNKMRVRMAKGIDRNTRPEIEESSAVLRKEIRSNTFLKGQIGPRVGRHDGSNHFFIPRIRVEITFLTVWSAPAEYREAGEYQEIPDVCQRRKTP